MKSKATKPHFELNETWVEDYPQVSYDLSQVINSVRVIGGKPKKAKHKVHYTAVAKKTHPLSPWRLGRGGRPRYISTRIEDGGLRTLKECRELAQSTLNSGLVAGVTMTVDGIVDPTLEEWDMIKVSVGELNIQTQLKQFTLPLTAGDSGSYGYVRRIVPKGGARGVRRHKHKHKKHHKGDKRKGAVTADGKNR